MPDIKIVFYCEMDGTVPVLEWLQTVVLRKDKKLFAKCFEAIESLSHMGWELRRPYAALLRDGIYELRIKYYRENYRILYYFYKSGVAVLAHSMIKESVVPYKDIELAIMRRGAFIKDPEAHTYEE